jgi:hypothetical protein
MLLDFILGDGMGTNKSIVLLCAILLAGCASKATDLEASYVSPNQYRSYDCDQLMEEGQRVSQRAAVASGQQDKKRTGDAVVTTVGAIVFWPALFFIDGDGPKAAEVSRLKGEMEAIEQASIQKKCNIQFRRK